jgi:capsule polysaccharide export protein KpsE/RkpR
MPLSEAEREVISREADGSKLPMPTQWIGGTEVLYRLWLKRTRIGLWVLVGFALSLLVGLKYPKYESTVQIMPPDGGGSSGLAALLPALSKAPGLVGLGDLMGAKTTGAVFMKVLGSRSVSDHLIEKFHLRERWGLTYMEDARLKLAKRTDIADDKKSGVIAVTVREHDPQLAMDLAQGYVDELNAVMSRVSTSAAGREREFIEKRLADEKSKLQEAEQQFSQFASTNMALDVPEQTKVTVEAAARLQGELIATRAQLEALKQTYTDENIRVRSAQAHINELERELGKINSGRGPAAAVQDSSNPYPSVRALPLLGVKWADLYRDTKIKETVVELLTQQYEMARIQEAKDIATAKLLDPPSKPEHRRPSWLLITIAGTFLFTLLACAGYFLKDLWDHWNHDDPRRMLLAHVLQSGPGRLIPKRGNFTRRAEKPDQMSQL